MTALQNALPVWKSLPPTPIANPSNLCKTDPNHFVFVTSKEGIYLYDTNSVAWTSKRNPSKYVPLVNESTQPPRIAYDPKTNQLFISGDGLMKIYNFEQENADILNYGYRIVSYYYSPLICINSVCHIIGDSGFGGIHSIWDDNNKKLSEIYRFAEYEKGFSKFGLIHDEINNELYLFGGYDHSCFKRLNVIQKYSFSSGEWNRLTIELPSAGMEDFGIVITSDQRYVILLGGYHTPQADDAIYILDLYTMNIIISSIKLPFRGYCRAIIMDGERDKDLLINGFVKKVKTEHKIHQVPQSLISLMGEYIFMEFVHVLNRNGDHWKIDVDHIIHNGE